MRGTWHWAGWALAALAAPGLSGCGVERHGAAARYAGYGGEKIAVVMPPGAPYISAQFMAPQKQAAEDSISGHDGIDIWGALRSPVIAAAPGRVAASFYEPVYGNRVVIDHGRDSTGARHWTVYKHLKDRLVEEGAEVARGRKIGTMGATGALGMMVHLHFETRRGADPLSGEALDPQLFWVGGIGRVTCLEPGLAIPADRFRITYPVPCRKG